MNRQLLDHSSRVQAGWFSFEVMQATGVTVMCPLRLRRDATLIGTALAASGTTVQMAPRKVL